MTVPTFDVLVYGATPGGIAAALVADRKGLSVALVERSSHLGGFLTSGLGVMDTMYDGGRAALYDEFCARILSYYENTYGPDSAQLTDARPSDEWPLRVEPSVAGHLIDAWLAETRITVLTERVLISVERSGATITGARFADGTDVRAETFIDATYEADLAAIAGARYRVGRESRDEYGEPHAGRIFTRQILSSTGLGEWPREASTGALNLRRFKSVSLEIFAGSTGEGDSKVQAYSYRVTLCNDAANRRIPAQPDGYDPEVYRAIDHGRPIGPPNLPNGKRFWFRNLPGGSIHWPEASETERDRIRAMHRDFALGYLYFLQNDETVPAAVRAEAQEYGLALDEYTDNDNFPYEPYVREARRIVGEYVFSELDASLAPGLERTPVHRDSIAFAEWFLDSHEVSDETRFGSSADGKILLTELTRPSQIPARVLFAQGIDNLIVPVAMSSTHVGWGTLRLEPVWMHTGEVAGRIAALSHFSGLPATRVDIDTLQRELLAAGSALSFFNDVDIADGRSSTASIQYFATRGFFPRYDARPDDPLSAAVARLWVGAVVSPPADETAFARQVAQAEALAGPSVSEGGLFDLLAAAELIAGSTRFPAAQSHGDRNTKAEDAPLSRGRACQILYTL